MSKGRLALKKKEKALGELNRWQDRLAETLVILLLCVHPLYLNADRYIQLTWHKFVFFALYVGVILFAALLLLFLRGIVAWEDEGFRIFFKHKLTVADWAVLGFAAVTLISAVLSQYDNVWIGVAERHDGAVTQLMYVAIFFIVSRFYIPRERDFGLFGISAILVSLLGVLQFYGMDIFKLWPVDIPAYYRENLYDIFFRSTLGNVNIVSAYTCVAVLLCGFLFIRTPQSKWQAVWLAGGALSFWLMLLAKSYSGMVGMALTVFLALPFIIENRMYLGRFLILLSSLAGVYVLQTLLYNVNILHAKTAGSLAPFAAAFLALLAGGIFLTWWKKREPDANAPVKWKLGVILIASTLVVGLLSVEALGRRENGPIGDKDVFYQARELLHGNIADEFGTNRVYIWRHALSVFPQNPVIGSGPDTFAKVFPEDAQWHYGERYDKAHNEYLQILICQGVLGLLCYLVFLGAIFGRSVRRAFRNPLLMAVLAAFTGYSIQAFFNISVPIASQMLWAMAGILGCRGFSGDVAKEIGEQERRM